MTKQEIDRLYSVAAWYKGLAATNNTAFMPLFADEHRYLVLKGGGGSGKSIFAGRKLLERVTTEEGHRFLVCRKVARTLRESCFKQLCGQLAEHYGDSGYKVNKSDMVISFPNGNEILFAGLDDVEKLKSIYNITGIWIEEASEVLQADFDQLDIRLRGETKHYKQIIVSFNPISIMHWLKARFFDRKDSRTRIHESTYKDNRFLDAEAIQTLESFRDTDEYYYSVYCLGQWGVTGKTIFDAKAISKRLQDDLAPIRRGFFAYDDDGLRLDNIKFEDDASGVVAIYADVIPGVPYVIGCDTAGTGSDSFVAQVLDNRNGEQVCTLRAADIAEDEFARQVYCLATYYNTALVGVETNFSTYPVLELERLGYMKQYVRETVDDYTHKVKNSFGFLTNAKTRPVIIAELVKVVREDVKSVCDKATLEEMLTFIRNPETLKPEADEGAHDDCVMSLAIAHYIRPQQSYLQRADAGEVTWTASQREDYESATAEEKQYLIQKWGRPKR